MPKDDNPPPYEDAVTQPKHANLPEVPQQTGPLPPPPSYTPGPAYGGPHVSWGQTGAYPPPGVWMGPGFGPSGTIPTLSAGVDTNFVYVFYGQVYLILAAQLVLTFSVVAVFTFVEPVKMFVINYPGIYYASLVIYFAVYCILVCCKEPRRRFPWNLVLLGVFVSTPCNLSHYYETKAVFIAMIITAIVCVAVTIFCFQTKVDFTSCGGLLSISAILLTIIGIVTAVVLTFQYIPWLHMVYAAIGAIVYTLFLVYNTQLLIGNRELAISPEEYIYGALSLYIDVVNIFLFILQVSGAATD
uniref:Uncharacterized protein n=1 Tax=Periophthalmus magnuspinnatus TaxID=409849 RepID=A0A3B3ZNA9_9GOBI